MLLVLSEDTVYHAVLNKQLLVIVNQHVSILVPRLNYDGQKDRMCACRRREREGKGGVLSLMLCFDDRDRRVIHIEKTFHTSEDEIDGTHLDISTSRHVEFSVERNNIGVLNQ